MKIILSHVTINTSASLSMARNNCASKTSYKYEIKAKHIFLSPQPAARPPVQESCGFQLCETGRQPE